MVKSDVTAFAHGRKEVDMFDIISILLTVSRAKCGDWFPLCSPFSFLSSFFLCVWPATARGPGWPAHGGRDGLGSIRLQVQPGAQLLSGGATGQSYTQHLLEVCQVNVSASFFFGESFCFLLHNTALYSQPVLTQLQRNSLTFYLVFYLTSKLIIIWGLPRKNPSKTSS